MKFFTPQLYLQFNSPNEREADAAQQSWDEALEQYDKHLRGLRRRLSPAALRLARLSLHDAELLAFEAQGGAEAKPSDRDMQPMQLLTVRRDDGDEVVTILYSLADRIRRSAGGRGWPFSRERLHWLYDELDAGPSKSAALHRILFSDGSVVEIPFVSAIIHRYSLHGERVAQRA